VRGREKAREGGGEREMDGRTNGCVFCLRDMVSVLVIRAFGELLVCEAEYLRDLYRSECERFGMIGFVIGIFD
jgi:hypothetical protein